MKQREPWLSHKVVRPSQSHEDQPLALSSFSVLICFLPPAVAPGPHIHSPEHVPKAKMSVWAPSSSMDTAAWYLFYNQKAVLKDIYPLLNMSNI